MLNGVCGYSSTRHSVFFLILVCFPLSGCAGGVDPAGRVDPKTLDLADEARRTFDAAYVMIEVEGALIEGRMSDGFVRRELAKLKEKRPIVIFLHGCAGLGRGRERFVFCPWGTAGGKPGAKARVVVNPGTNREVELGKLDIFYPDPGDVVTILTPGGGGYGDPLERPPERAAEGVRFGYVSDEAARRDYGVVLAGGTVDAAGTEALRARMGEERGPFKEFDFGPEREAWESVFDDATMQELNALLMQLGANVRARRRREIFNRVVPRLAEGAVVPLHERVGDPDPARRRVEEELARLREELSPPRGASD